MAKRMKANTATTVRTTRVNATWLRNAMKSVGLSVSDSIKEISPNIYEVVSTGANTSKNVISSIRRNQGNTNRIADTLSSNKYVKFAQTAYKNAMSDIKTGNFYNTERQSDAIDSSLTGGGEEGGFSFGDDGADGGSNVNVSINTSDSEGLASLSKQMADNTAAQLKVQKASMDAYIAVNAASMQQAGQIGSEIVNQLTNVNNNLTALVQYNNENMTRFIDASIAYYESMGRKNDTGFTKNDKVTAKDVLNNSSGGIDLNRYKSYVKQQFKSMAESSDLGMIKSIVEDDMTMNMLVSNPLGFASKMLTSYMMPKILKTSIESMETTFSNFMPTMLSKLADLADDTTDGLIGTFKRSIGKTFGLKSSRIKDFKDAKIDRGATPFDGETKHAITEVITKELRDQTGYLQIIASHYDRNAKANVRKNAEYWSWEKKGYIKQDEIDTQIADQIVSAVKGVFSDTKFGSAMQELVHSQRKEESKKEMEFSLEELFMEIEKSGKHLSLPDLINLVDNIGATPKTKKVISKYIKKLAANDPDAYHSVNVARIRSQAEANDAKTRILSDPVAYQLYNSSFANADNIDEVLAKTMGYGKANAKNRRSVKTVKMPTFDNSSNELDTSSLMGSITGHAKDFMNKLMSGDSRGLLEEGTNFIVDSIGKLGGKISHTLFNDETGVFAGVKNEFSDAFKSIKYTINGKAYTDSKGNSFDDTDDSVLANFRNIGNEVKDGIMLKVFGKVKGEDGKYTKSEETKGILSKITDTFKAGFDGWTDAFFGTDGEQDPEEARKKQQDSIKEYLKKALPNTITGAAIGAGVGMVTSGSLLGTMVLGPIGGVVMGSAIGLASKSEKFQNWLFGEKDEDGNRLGGLISKKTQDFFKENKTFLVGSGAVGALTGGITGGGFLGNLVGGPVAGAIMGLAGGIVLKSKTVNEFLFGDEETGKKGIRQKIADAFNSTFKGSKESSEGAKLLGMSAIGTLAGGLTAAAVGKMGIIGASLTPLGPIGGALAGLALSIKAQSGSIKEWLFGKEDGLDIGDGRKVRKQGVLGRIGNAINANIIRPMKTEFSYIGKDFMHTVKWNILQPFSDVAELGAQKLGNIATMITEGISEKISPVTQAISKGFEKAISPITKTIGKATQSVTDFAYKTARNIISTPGKLIEATLDVLDVKNKVKNFFRPVTSFVGGLFKDIKDITIGKINSLFKGIGHMAKGFFIGLSGFTKDGLEALGIGAKWLGRNTVGRAVNALNNTRAGRAINEWGERKKAQIGGTISQIRDRMQGAFDGDDPTGFWARRRENKRTAKAERAQIKADLKTAKRHDKNAKLINKWTKGQFSEDTEEAREWLKYHKPNEYRKLLDIDPETGKARNTSITDEQNAAKIAKEGRGTAGMSSDQLARANVSELNEEARQTYYLQGIFQMMKGKNWDGTDKGGPTLADLDKAEEEKKKQESEADEITLDEDGNPVRSKPHKGYGGLFGRTRYNIDKLRGIRNANKAAKARKKAILNGEEVEDASISEIQKALDSRFLGRTRQKFASVFTGKTLYNLIKGTDLEARLPHKATGGPLEAGKSVIVGEESPEIITPEEDGYEVLNEEQAEERVKKAKKRKKKRRGLKDAVRRMKHNMNVLAEDDNASSKDAAVILSNLRDSRENSLNNALAKAKTAKELQKEREEEKFREEQKAHNDAMLAATKKNADTNEDFSLTWKGIFSKKGLITGGLIAAFLFLKSKLPGMIDGIKSTISGLVGSITPIISSIATGIGTFLTSSVWTGLEEFLWTWKKKSRTDGNTAAEQLEKNINDIKEGNILTDESGESTRHTDSRLKFLSRTAMNVKNSTKHGLFESKITKAEKGAANVTKKLGKAIGKTAPGRFIKDKAETVAIKAMYAGDSVKAVGKKAGAKVAGSLKSKGVKIATKVKDSKGLTKIIGYLDDFTKLIVEKFAKKGGKSSVITSIMSKVTKALKNSWDDIGGKIIKKVGLVGGTKAGSAAISFGVSEAIFASIGALNGVSGTAKLFEVSPDQVDGTMRTIAGIFGALTGTTVGSIIDVILSIVSDVMGMDILSSLATGMYTALVGKDSKKASQLKNARASFKEAYSNERDKELKKQWETQKKAGIIGEDVTFEDFATGVEDGTYSASYDSFQDWNAKKNKSLGDKAATVVGKTVKGVGKGLKAAGKFLFGNKETTYTDSKGNTYTKNSDGTYTVRDSSGNNLGSIAKDAIPKDAKKSTVKNKGIFAKTVDNIKKDGLAKTIRKTQVAGVKAVARGVKGFANKYILSSKEKVWYDTTDGTYYKPNGRKFDHYSAAGDKIGEGIDSDIVEPKINSGVYIEGDLDVDSPLKKGLKSMLKKIAPSRFKQLSEGLDKTEQMFTKFAGKVSTKASSILNSITEKGIIGYLGGVFKNSKSTVWYDTDFSYYKENKDGSYNKYNMNGDLITENIEAEKIEDMKARSLLTEGELVEDSKAKKAMKDIRSALEDVWDKAKETAKSGLDKFKNWITGGNGGFGPSVDYAQSRGGRGSRSRITPGGRGPETLNGGTYYSQNDSRWANSAYNMGSDNATMGDSGCGPAAMAMAASDVTGRNVDPTQMASLAKATGNRDATGTNWNFINQASSMMGMNSSQRLNPSASEISAQLDSGNPVILSGTGNGDGSDPYTKSGHYVVATGKDANGNVMINDPRGKTYSKKYSINAIANKTGSSWSFGGNGIRKIFGGFGKKKPIKGGRGVDVQKWLEIVRAVKRAIAAQKPGYSQSKFIQITVGNRTISVRTDCSGYTGACLKFYGVVDERINLTSNLFADPNNSIMKQSGFTSRAWSGWDSLSEGDIIAKNGHVEIFARNEGNKHYVYNCGGDTSTNSAVPTPSGHNSYTTVWSPGAAGASAVTSTGGDASVATSDSGSTGTKFEQLSSLFGSFFSEFGSRALTGDFSNTDYSSVLNPQTSSDSGTSGSSVATANITGNNIEKSVWDYFTGLGYSKAATTGILANLKAESGVNPKTIQNNGRGPAAGIAQWENYNTKSGRWKSLSDYAKAKGKDWTDLGSQLEFIHKELSAPAMNTYFKYAPNMSKAGTSPTTYEEWKKSTNYETATRQFEGAFERAGKPHMEKRIAYAKAYNDTFAGGGKGGGFGDASISKRRRKSNSYNTNQGGRGTTGVDYSSTSTIQSNYASNRYGNASSASDYITTSKDSGVTDLLMNAIEILAAIAGNTHETSSKLNALKNLQNGNGNTSNVIVTGNNGSTNNISNSPSRISSNSKKDITARQIAQGGY